MVVLRSGKVLKEPTVVVAARRHRRITADVPVYGRVMQYRGQQTRATMRRGPDRFHEPLNLIPIPHAPASPTMPPLDPPARRRGIEEAFPDFQPGPLPTQVPSRHHREDDMTCDCKDYPSLSLLGYTPLCIHRMIDPLSPRYAAYLPQDYTMFEGERGSDAVAVAKEYARLPDPDGLFGTPIPHRSQNPPASPASDPTTEPDANLYKEEKEDDFDDSDLELTAWTDPSRRAQKYNTPIPAGVA